jgi:hypothetical protein
MSARGRYRPSRCGRTKLMNILFTRELARRVEERCHGERDAPGFVRTGFGHNNPGLLRTVVKWPGRLRPDPEQGAGPWSIWRPRPGWRA